MKPREIKGARVRKGYTQDYMAQQLSIGTASYRVKESGRGRFSDREKVAVAKLLDLTPQQMNDYLYDGILPI